MFFSTRIFLLVVLWLSLLPSIGHTQTLKTIEDLEKAKQEKVDKGVNMLGHTSTLYMQMDSLLNMAYNNLRKKLTTKEKEILKQEQLAWLKKRDSYFKKIYKDTEKEYKADRRNWGEVEYLSVYIQMIDFVKERTIILIERQVEKK